jgi:hypothetical protein
LPRALKNLPQSLLNFGRNAFPVSPPKPVLGDDGRYSFPPISLSQGVGDFLLGVGRTIGDPGEAFANDPVGTVALPAMAFGSLATPPARAGFSGAASGMKAELPNVPKWGKAGGTAGAVLGGAFGDSPWRGAEYGGIAGGAFPLLRGAVKGGIKGIADSLPYDIKTPPEPKQLGPALHNLPGPPDPSGPILFTPPESWSQPAQPIKPIHPTTVDVSTGIPDLQPTAAMPSGSPVSPNVARFKHGAEHTDLIRQNHATAGEFGLKHNDLSKAAKAVYGVNSYSHLSYPQLTALHEYLLKNKVLPTSPRDLLPE